MSGHLFKMPLILNIGITGHRHGDRFSVSEANRVEAQITDALTKMQNALETLDAQCGNIFSEEKPALHFITAMADGADQIGAEAAFKKAINVNAVLPFHKQEYVRDFTENGSVERFNGILAQAGSVFELAGDRNDAAAAYEEVGHFLVAKSDILIAVWDGGVSGGRGGTTEVVEHALEAGISVIHIHAKENTPAVIITNDEGENGENTLDQLPDLIKRAVLPSDDKSQNAIEKFQQEKEKRFCPRISYPLFQSLMFMRAFKWSDIMHKPFLKADDDNVTAIKHHVDPQTSQRFDQYVSRVFHFSDSLAIRYAQLYRSGFVANFFLAAFAVVCAVLGGLNIGAGKEIYVPLETVLIFLIIVNTVWGQKQDWHQNWMDYRHLAERLRLSPVWLLLGTSRQSIFVKRNLQAEHQMPGWVAWYGLTASKAVGIPTLRITPEITETIRAVLAKIAAEQETYHTSNMGNMKKLDHRSHHAGKWLFYITFAACLLYLVLPGDYSNDFTDKIITFVTAVFPTFGAAIYGIKSVADFRRNADQSGEIEGKMSKILVQLNEPDITYNRLLSIANKMDDIMLDDLVDWRQLYRDKQLSLP